MSAALSTDYRYGITANLLRRFGESDSSGGFMDDSYITPFELLHVGFRTAPRGLDNIYPLFNDGINILLGIHRPCTVRHVNIDPERLVRQAVCPAQFVPKPLFGIVISRGEYPQSTGIRDGGH